MRHKNVMIAKSEAERFLRAVDEFEQRYENDERFKDYMGITGFKETAAVKRASLDLTRALADLRKP